MWESISADGEIVGRQITHFVGIKITPLPGLCVLQQGLGLRELQQNFLRVIHPDLVRHLHGQLPAEDDAVSD